MFGMSRFGGVSGGSASIASRSPARLIVADGASNIYGGSGAFAGSSISAGYGTPDGTHTLAKLLDLVGRPEWQAVNFGTPSRMLATALPAFTSNTSFKAMLDSDSIVIIDLGANDLSIGTTSAVVIADLQSYATAIKATGAKAVFMTILSRTDGFSGGADQASYNAGKDAVNTAAANGTIPFDAVVATDANLNGDTAANSLTYFNADKIHLNDTGHYLRATLVATALNPLVPITFPSIWDSVVSRWPFDLKTNTYFPDVVGGVHQLTVGTVSTGSGRSGRTCAVLPGANTDYLRTGTTIDPKHNFYSGTISAWVNGSSIAYGHIMGTSQLYSVYNSNVGGGTGMMDWTAFQPAGVMTAITSAWNHIAITFELQNGANGGPGAACKNYLNGTLVGSAYATRAGGNGPFCLGSRNGSNAAAFSINDCVLRNRILTAAEVAAEYALG